MTYEKQVHDFYDNAIHCYRRIMENRWHHGDPDAVALGLPRLRCCAILEERLIALTGVKAGDRVLLRVADSLWHVITSLALARLVFRDLRSGAKPVVVRYAGTDVVQSAVSRTTVTVPGAKS